jgi:hypothetical protein
VKWATRVFQSAYTWRRESGPRQHVSTMTTMESPSVAERSGGARVGRLWSGPVFAIAGVIAMLGTRFFLVIWKYSINVFFYDQWEYLTPFFRHQPSIAELFSLQHGPHREGIALLPTSFFIPSPTGTRAWIRSSLAPASLPPCCSRCG